MIKLIFHPRILRLYLLGLLLALGMGALLVRLWSFQVEMREEFEAKLPSPTTIRVREPAVRGEIRDRNGLVLATNDRNYALVVNLGELREAWHQENPGKVRTLREDLGNIFEIYLRPRLSEAGVAVDVDGAAVDRHWKINKEFVSLLLREHLSWDEVTRISARSSNLPGVRVIARPQRRYPYGALAGHIVGYLRPGDGAKDLSSRERKEFKFDVLDDVGVAGVEAAMDDILSGTPGVREILQDVNGRVVGQTGYTPPVRGDDVYLTIDLRLQYVAERALRDAGVGQGAAVVIDPRNGALLAMAAVPSFDPNHFIPSVDRDVFRSYGDPKRYNPLLSQALRPAEPGSTYKVPVAISGGLKGLEDNSFSCSPLLRGTHAFRCWITRQSGGSHGTLNLADALKVSCNGFFYRYGNAIGGEDFAKGLEILGFGSLSGVELKGVGEDPGLVVGTDAWRRAYGYPDGYSPTVGDLANAAIGQGGSLATPLQMASAVSVIANGGTVYQTRVVSHAIGRNGSVTLDNLPHPRAQLQEEGIPQKMIDTVREGMWRVVNAPGGTGRRVAMEDGWTICGKTGTAQTPRKDRSNAWFICFAPYDHGDAKPEPKEEKDQPQLHDAALENKEPRYAVCVLVRNGHAGGTVAAPVAKRVLEGALALERNQPLNLGPLDEAQGHDRRIDAIDYGEAPMEDFGEIPAEDPANGEAPALVNPEVISDDAPLTISEDGYIEAEPVEPEPVESH